MFLPRPTRMLSFHRIRRPQKKFFSPPISLLFTSKPPRKNFNRLFRIVIHR
jgi:hypothetical protein